MHSSQKIQATFRVRREDVAYDEILALLGSEDSLGSWRKPVYCQKVGPKSWEASVDLTRGTTVYWSCVIVDIQGRLVKRESRPRRRVLTIEESCSRLQVTGEWNRLMAVSQLDSDSEVMAKDKSDRSRKEASKSLDLSVMKHDTVNHDTGTCIDKPDEPSSEVDRPATCNSAISKIPLRIHSNKAPLPTPTETTKEILVKFQMKRKLKAGENCLAIIGSHASLGRWKVDHAAYGQYLEDDVWEVLVRLTAGTPVFWSCVTLDRQGSLVSREAAPRRRVLATEPDSTNLTVTGAWDSSTELTRYNPEEIKEASEPQPTRTSFSSVCRWALEHLYSSVGNKNNNENSKLLRPEEGTDVDNLREGLESAEPGRLRYQVVPKPRNACSTTSTGHTEGQTVSLDVLKKKATQQKNKDLKEHCESNSGSGIGVRLFKFLAFTQHLNLL